MLDSLRAGFRTGLRAATGDPEPSDERWWRGGNQFGSASVVGPSSSGITVTPELAFQVSCFFLGVRLIAETVSTIPLKFYRDLGDDEREVASDYWLRPVLDTKRGLANPWQTAQQWREAQTARMIAWGAGLSQIKPGAQRGGPPLELWPLDPSRVCPEQLADGRLRFKVTRDDGTPEWLSQDQVCRQEGLSLHRFVPANVLALARECIGVWLAVERYEGLFFAQGARPSVIVKHPGKPDETTAKVLKENVRQWQGLRNMFKVFVAEAGMSIEPFGFSPRDSMLPEVRTQLALEVCRWLNLPPHMLKAGGGAGQEEAAASMEQLAQEYVDYTIRPLCVRIEAAYGRDLITEPDIFAEHSLDGLLRGDILKRFQAYTLGIMNGFLSENEVRLLENRNRVAGLDEPRRSVNQDRGANPGDSQRQSDPRQTQPPQGAVDKVAIEAAEVNAAAAFLPTPIPAVAAAPTGAMRRLRLIARNNAARVVRKECLAISDKAPKMASDPPAWAAWVRDFYAVFTGYVSETLELEPTLAKGYAERHRQELLLTGVSVLEQWMTTAVDELTAMTLEESNHG